MPEDIQNLRPGDAELSSQILSAIGEEKTPDEETGAPADDRTQQRSAPAPAGEADAAPDQGQPSGDDAGIDTEAPPAVEPPASWARDYKEAFKALPPDMQQYVAERERARDTELRRGQDEAANLRKAAEAEQLQAKQLREQYHQELSVLVPSLKARVNAWANVDWVDLAAKDPAEYTRLRAIYDTEKEQTARAEAELAQQNMQAAARAQDAESRRIATQEERLVQFIPDWKDVPKGRSEFADIKGYLRKAGEALPPEERMVWERTVSSLSDALQISLVRKAMLYDRAQARIDRPAAPQKAPKVQRPGPARAENAADDEIRRAQWAALNKTGDVRDAASIIKRTILGL